MSAQYFMRVAAAAGALGLMAACGGSGAFSLTQDDNNPQRLAAAFARVTPPAAGQPVNALGKPLAFLVTRPGKGAEKSLVAYDLQAETALWTIPSDVSSKVLVGTNFVAYREGETAFVGRDLRTGKQIWKTSVGAGFVGATADASRVFYVESQKSGAKPVWWLIALDGKSGSELWRADAPGQLGVPAARGGLVFSPFLNQWLAVLDAVTGEQLTRVRGIDEEISFVRATSTDVFFGSKRGVFRLDERAASGKRAQSTYGTAKLPEFVRAHYHWDAFDPVQTTYSAYDRNRILWRAQAADNGSLTFVNQQVVVHAYRFFFGFDSMTGDLKWAYSHPRVDAVGSSDTGPAIAFADFNGELGALDAATGRRIYKAKLSQGVLGATFDAEGWAPAEEDAAEEGDSTAAALASIARDRDARYNDVKRFAIATLANMPGAAVSTDLLALISDPRTPPKIYEKAVESLVARKDPSALPALVGLLKVEHDYIAGTAPKGLGVAARAIAAMGEAPIEPAQRASVVEALVAHLGSPETSPADLVEVVQALGAISAGAELGPLGTFVLTYRADPTLTTQVTVLSTAIDVLLDHGGAAERELVAFVAGDPRTEASVAAYATRALQVTDVDAPPRAPGEQSGEKAEKKGAEAPSAPATAPAR